MIYANNLCKSRLLTFVLLLTPNNSFGHVKMRSYNNALKGH